VGLHHWQKEMPGKLYRQIDEGPANRGTPRDNERLFIHRNAIRTFFALQISPGKSWSPFRARFPVVGGTTAGYEGVDRNATAVSQTDKLTSVPAYANWEPDGDALQCRKLIGRLQAWLVKSPPSGLRDVKRAFPF
jgi:hypothetical protein